MENNDAPVAGKKKVSASIEEQLGELEALAKKMRSSKIGVQESVKCLEEGLAKAKKLEEALNEIDKQVATICDNAGVPRPTLLRTRQ